MKSIVNDIPNIIDNEMISKISVSDYVDASVDEATVLTCELYSKLTGTKNYNDNTVYNGKNIYYTYYESSILGPTIVGRIIIDGKEITKQKTKGIEVTANGSLFLEFKLSNPEINENNYNEYLKELLNIIKFYK